MTTITNISIDRRYAGPPFAANGGYVVGLLAEHLGTRNASVDLMAPAPLERPLEIQSGDGTAVMRHEGTEVARAVEACPVVRTIRRTDFVTASVASGDVDPTDHPFPNCFVCGNLRGTDDGLHLLPGGTGSGTFAVPWIPAPWQADPTGAVPVRMVTAALDCPSAFPAWEAGSISLLANMTFQIDRLPWVGEHLVVTAWNESVSGRKMHSVTTIHDAEGDRVALARTLWVRVGEERLAELTEAAA